MDWLISVTPVVMLSSSAPAAEGRRARGHESRWRSRLSDRSNTTSWLDARRIDGSLLNFHLGTLRILEMSPLIGSLTFATMPLPPLEAA